MVAQRYDGITWELVMGVTKVRFGHQSCSENDTIIALWLTLLVREMDAISPWIRETREEWHLQASQGFDFGVTPGLDRVVTDDDRKAVILALSQKALRSISVSDEPISAKELNEMEIMGDSNFTKDVPIDRVRAFAQCWIRILNGKPGDDATP
jgi:hypothetical protein